MLSRHLSRRVGGVFSNGARSAACAAMLGAAALGAGCAAHKAQPYGVAGPSAASSAQHAGVPQVVIEADGLPSQLAPRNRPGYPDDPTEPWSPNYGSAPSSPATATSPAKTAQLTAPVKVSAPVQQAPAMPVASSPSLHPDEIIRRAIAAHEMRQN